jgi:hypothetical protein
MRTENGELRTEKGEEIDNHECEGISSEIFKMGGVNFARTMIYRYAAKWLVCVYVVAIVGLILGVAVDLHIFIAGMMIIFIILPGILATFYYTHGLRRECYVNVLRHKLITCEYGITARIYFEEKEEERTENGEQRTEEKKLEHFKDEFFSFDEMKSIERNVHACMVMLKKPLSGFLWIPEKAYKDPEEYNRTVLRVAEKLENSSSKLEMKN